jgi:hypothetical protein
MIARSSKTTTKSNEDALAAVNAERTFLRSAEVNFPT